MDFEPLKDAYWAIVMDCLRLFHGYAPADANAAAMKLRGRVEDPDRRPSWYMKDLFYHEEPFYVACEIARHELALSDFREAYFRVMDEHYGPIDWMYASPYRSAA